MKHNSPQPNAEPRAARELNGDRPKEHLSDDRLGYANFARALAQSIAKLAPSDGIVLAINGPWGSGKTSAVNMVLEALDETANDQSKARGIITVRFNPWWFSGQENLTKAFFSEVAASVGTKVPDKVIAGLKAIARRASNLREIAVAALEFVPGGTLVKGLAGAALKELGELGQEDHSLFKAREDLCKALREQDKSILVVIDDIDRLPPDEVRQIFRLVKSVADLPHVVHLLIFDRKVARLALPDAGDSAGPEWLEKIVQASFDLPPVHPVDLHRLFFEGLEALLGDFDLADRVRWSNVFMDAIAPWLGTPRDVGRLLNALRVSWPAVGRDVDLADFVAIETLRLFEPNLYAFIRDNGELLTDLSDLQEKETGTKILDTVTPVLQQRVQSALSRLFPRLEKVWDNHGYSSGILEGWDRERRICVARRFPTYFRFGVGDDVLSREALGAFISNITNRASVLETVAAYAALRRPTGGTKAAVLLDELSSAAATIPEAHLPQGIVNLLDAADSFVTPADAQAAFMAIPPLWRFWFVIENLLKRLDEPARADTVKRAFSSAASLSALRFGLQSFRASLGLDPDSPSAKSGDPLITASVFEKAERTFRRRLRGAAKDGKLLEASNPVGLLLEWRRLDKEATITAWVRRTLADDAAVLRLAQAATQTVRSQAFGDYAIRESPSVQRASLEKVLDVEKLRHRLDAIAAKTCDSVAAKIISDFNRGLTGSASNC